MTEGPRGADGPRDEEPRATIDEPDEARGGVDEPARQAPPERGQPAPGAMEPVEPGRARHKVGRTRASALWTALGVGVLVLIAILIFVVQNSDKVKISFLWMHGTLGLGIALLISAILGILLALAVGTVRILQLRRMAKRPPPARRGG